MKKTLSLALALVMCLGLLPAPAAALSDGIFEYTLSDNSAVITGVTGWNLSGGPEELGNLVIPSSIAGKPVTEIKIQAFDAFNRKRLIKSVVIPDSVKKIERRAFVENFTMVSLTLSEGLTEIGSDAFMNCGLSSVVIPESVTKLGEGAFSGNKSLTSIKLPSTLKEIPYQFLEGCQNLTSVEIPKTVENIDSLAFARTGLTSIAIPRGVPGIPLGMCSECSNLSEVDLPAGITAIGQNAFYGCSALQSICLPTSVKIVGDSSFKKSGLKEVILPYGAEKVYVGAFSGCDSLTAIYVPSTITTLSGVPSNAIVYCMPDSAAKQLCEKNGYSYLTDASCDTRINVLYNGKRISFGSYGQNPEIVNSRTMVPLRSIFEAMGADVQWDQATKTVTATRGGTKVVMTLGQAGYTVNGAAKTMDTPPMLLNSRTMVPVRVVAESFGADVDWHAASATVIINE